MTYPTPKEYPVSVISFDIFNSENKVNTIRTFYTRDSFEEWISLVKKWDNLNAQKSKIEILDTVETELI